MVLNTKTRITADEYYQLPEYAEHDFIELIDGEVVIPMPPRTKHQVLVVNIILLFGIFRRIQKGQIFTAPTEVYFDAENIYEPDALYLTADTKCVVEEKKIVGAPELIVEVLSPETARKDRKEKLLAYESHGVLEYWITDPFNEYIEVRVLRDGKFDLLGTYYPGDTFESTVLKGQPIAVAELFAE